MTVLSFRISERAWYVLGSRESGAVWKFSALTFTGEMNRSCSADLIRGMLNRSYWYAGGFDDWFLNCDAYFTADDIAGWFLKSLSANGADTSADVDGLTGEDAVMLKADGSVYSESGVLATVATQSMRKAGCPYDNTPMERYFNTLKNECTDLFEFPSEDSLYLTVQEFAYVTCNHLRLHCCNARSTA